jgi:CDP-glucose 4,6-dehydratase
MVRCLRRGEPIALRNPHSVRPWQHVLEPLSGYLNLAAAMLLGCRPELCEGWNFGPMPGEEIPVGELAERFIAAWGGSSPGPVVSGDAASPSRAREAGLLRLCIDKAVWELGWKPQWGVHEAIDRTVRWFKQFDQPGCDMQAECLRDIADYESCLAATTLHRPLAA